MTERITADRRHAHRRTIPAVVVMTTLVVGMGLGSALVRAYDTRLQEALQTLQKAAAWSKRHRLAPYPPGSTQVRPACRQSPAEH